MHFSVVIVGRHDGTKTVGMLRDGFVLLVRFLHSVHSHFGRNDDIKKTIYLKNLKTLIDKLVFI